MLMLPILSTVKRPKVLEIGLGCGMPDGPGESVDVGVELGFTIPSIVECLSDRTCSSLTRYFEILKRDLRSSQHTSERGDSRVRRERRPFFDPGRRLARVIPRGARVVDR